MTKMIHIEREKLESALECLGMCSQYFSSRDAAKMAEQLAMMPVASPLSRRCDHEVAVLGDALDVAFLRD